MTDARTTPDYASLVERCRDPAEHWNSGLRFTAADAIDRLRSELELANQKREFAEFEWNRATEHAQKRDAENERMKKALEEALTENAWNAYYCGVTKEGGKWMDGGRSEGEWLRGQMGLGDGWHDCKMIQDRIPEVVAKQIAEIAQNREP